MVRPSCPVLVIHDDDAFRKNLIAALDRQHFTVTVTTDGASALEILGRRQFRVVLLGLNLATGVGVRSVDALREARQRGGLGVIIVGDSDPRLRTCAPWADETLLKPVDPDYVAQRANTYCRT